MDKSIVESICGKKAERRLLRLGLPGKFCNLARLHLVFLRRYTFGAINILSHSFPKGKAVEDDFFLLEQTFLLSSIIISCYAEIEEKEQKSLISRLHQARFTFHSVFKRFISSISDSGMPQRFSRAELSPIVDFIKAVIGLIHRIAEENPFFLLKATVLSVATAFQEEGGLKPEEFDPNTARKLMALPLVEFLEALSKDFSKIDIFSPDAMSVDQS